MARTQGHGNPKWTREEVLLALALYFESGGRILTKDDPRVRGLSKLLCELPFHGDESRKVSFRNPDGVAFKLQNLHFLATGDGLGNTSRMDQAVWREYHEVPERVIDIASQIRRAAEVVRDSSFPKDVEEDLDFLEGRTLSEIHRRIERSASLRIKFVTYRRKKGPLECEICCAKPLKYDPQMADAIFEVHHIVPISQLGLQRTRLSDLALLCANCHRCVHRLISLNGEWLSITDCKILLGHS